MIRKTACMKSERVLENYSVQVLGLIETISDLDLSRCSVVRLIFFRVGSGCIVSFSYGKKTWCRTLT